MTTGRGPVIYVYLLTDVTALGTNFDPGDISATVAQLQATQPSVDDEDAYQDCPLCQAVVRHSPLSNH